MFSLLQNDCAAKKVKCKDVVPKSERENIESAMCDDTVKLGKNPELGVHISIGANSSFGNDLFINDDSYVGKDVHGGNGVQISSNSCIDSGVTLEDKARIGPYSKAVKYGVNSYRVIRDNPHGGYEFRYNQCLSKIE